MQHLSQPTPELLAKGKEIYNAQCSVCHGAQGKGDGPAGASLQPPARNFTSGEWKFGGGPLAVFQTITKGSLGTSMVGFGHLSLEDRWGLAHYVRSFTPNPPPDDPKVWENLSGALKTPQPEKPERRTSVEFAIEQIIKEAEQTKKKEADQP